MAPPRKNFDELIEYAQERMNEIDDDPAAVQRLLARIVKLERGQKAQRRRDLKRGSRSPRSTHHGSNQWWKWWSDGRGRD